MLGTSIGLGFIREGHDRMGDIVRAVDFVRGKDIEVEITSPHFVDPQGDGCMTEYRLKEKAAIGAATAKADGATLVEETGIALVAMTTRNGKSRAMTTAFKKHFAARHRGQPMPSPPML